MPKTRPLLYNLSWPYGLPSSHTQTLCVTSWCFSVRSNRLASYLYLCHLWCFCGEHSQSQDPTKPSGSPWLPTLRYMQFIVNCQQEWSDFLVVIVFQLNFNFNLFYKPQGLWPVRYRTCQYRVKVTSIIHDLKYNTIIFRIHLNRWHSDYNVIAEKKVILAMVYSIVLKIVYDKIQ